MNITPFAIFQSAFPDDSIEEGGHVLVPGGQNISRAIYDRLAGRGYDVSGFDQHSSYGWSFDLRGREGRFWLLVQHPDPWLLTVHDSRMIWSRALRGPADFVALIDQCRSCLSSIPRLSSVLWMSRKEFDAEFYKKRPKRIT